YRRGSRRWNKARRWRSGCFRAWVVPSKSDIRYWIFDELLNADSRITNIDDRLSKQKGCPQNGQPVGSGCVVRYTSWAAVRGWEGMTIMHMEQRMVFICKV